MTLHGSPALESVHVFLDTMRHSIFAVAPEKRPVLYIEVPSDDAANKRIAAASRCIVNSIPADFYLETSSTHETS